MTYLGEQHYQIAFLNAINILVSVQPAAMVAIYILDDTEFNEDRTLSITLLSEPDDMAVPHNITINETTVIIENDDPPGRLESSMSIEIFCGLTFY